MSDWRTMYMSIFANAGRRHTPTTAELDDIKRAVCDASRELNHGDDMWPIVGWAYIRLRPFTGFADGNGIVNLRDASTLGAGIPAPMLIAPPGADPWPSWARVKYVLDDPIWLVNGVTLEVIHKIEKVSLKDFRESYRSSGTLAMSSGLPEVWAPDGDRLQVWPIPSNLADPSDEAYFVHAAVDVGVPSAVYAAGVWSYVIEPFAMIVTDGFTNFFFKAGFQMLKARAEYHLWSNLWADPTAAGAALMRYREARKLLIDSGDRRQRYGWVRPYELPGY